MKSQDELIKELEDLKKLNEEQKQKKARLEGQLEILNKRMSDYGCSDIAEFEKLLTKNEEESAKLSTEIEDKLKEFNLKYETRL